MAKKTQKKGKRIGIVLYPTFDSLDVIGAHQVFHYACRYHSDSEVLLLGPDPKDLQHDKLKPYLAAAKKGEVVSGEQVKIAQDITYQDYLNDKKGRYQLDLIYVPGAMDTSCPLYYSQKMADNPFFKVLEKARQEAEIIASVCTGALLLGTAGLLAGRKATTHWMTATLLAQFPQVTLAAGYPRYVVDQNIFTGGGISSTIDEALAIVTALFDQQTAEKVQLMMQYHPDPPVKGGDPAHAKPEIIYEVSRHETPYTPGFSAAGDVFLYYLKHHEIPS
ncbi:DJ-1/PfpI family protein [Marinoscillum furvescens]|uniref:DJ-1/PfpI family protein n=1 Tax=Marinoscillum furvescens DSM 4134 TaxID=1122208 RepID=A0A3D9L2H2_MARFU|nr:DJ-1/PfpI family protein [Marinoscillum furvescens]RED97889.1 DJ-1/PfpI family protein [Marinoscillum furvescens DSM 4134]